MKPNTTRPRTKQWSLPGGVQVSGVRRVKDYLRGHPDLAVIVSAMCLRGREEFGDDAELTMRINHDQEIEDPYLILCVRLPNPVADLRKRLDAVWLHFEKELSKVSGWIILTTDFRKASGDGI